MQLHSQTTLILAALMFLALPAMVWLALRQTPDRGVVWWCTGSLLAGVGLILMGLRPWLPAVLSYELANTCLLASMVLWSQSLRISHGHPWPNSMVILALLMCAVFYSALLHWTTPSLRGLGMRLALGGLALHTAWWAWRLARRLRSSNATTIATTYLVLGLMLTLQGVWTARFISEPSPFSNSWDASLLALTALVTAMIGHFCYEGMVLEQAASEQVQARLAQQGARQTQWLDAEVQRMDRHRRMTILSGSLAHELNQPLTAALTNAELAQRQWETDAHNTTRLQPLLEQVEQGIDRTVQILQRIRASREPGAPAQSPLDLMQVLQQSLVQLEPDLQAQNVQLQLACPGTPVMCLGDEVALSQVLVNLLRNGVQAMAGQPRQVLTVSCESDEARLRLRIRDTGPGLNAEIEGRWGEPLVSTKTGGLGMGLAISRDIVAQHRGELSLRNHPDGGAEVLLCLPRLQEAA